MAGIDSTNVIATRVLKTQFGKLFCWGNGVLGQVGNGLKVVVNALPQTVLTDVFPKSFSSGKNHNCFVSRDGKGYCFGNNSYGQLGNGTDEDSEYPEEISVVKEPIDKVFAGDQATCVVTRSEKFLCFGLNGYYGVLGFDQTEEVSQPRQPEGIPDPIAKVVLGERYSCALTTKGDLYCGGMFRGRRVEEGMAFKRVDFGKKVIDFSIYHWKFCAVTEDHRIICEGKYAPVNHEEMRDVVKISDSFESTCVVDSSGRAFRGTRYRYFEQYNAPEKVVDFRCGYQFWCATGESGQHYCAGQGAFGKLGDGAAVDRRSPGKVAPMWNRFVGEP